MVTQTVAIVAALRALVMTTEHPFAYLRLRSDARKCCANTNNLVVFTPRPDLKLAICKRCMTKHRKLWCEPGTIFAKHLQTMGRRLLDFPHRRVMRGLV